MNTCGKRKTGFVSITTNVIGPSQMELQLHNYQYMFASVDYNILNSRSNKEANERFHFLIQGQKGREISKFGGLRATEKVT